MEFTWHEIEFAASHSECMCELFLYKYLLLGVLYDINETVDVLNQFLLDILGAFQVYDHEKS